eukprot:22707-Chlamydomonas_euryale.AAC.14
MATSPCHFRSTASPGSTISATSIQPGWTLARISDVGHWNRSESKEHIARCLAVHPSFWSASISGLSGHKA